jgi:hypothetical protein
MNMLRVNSSNLVAVRYDAVSQTLRIQFNSGLYDYYNVPQHIYNGLMSASSHGEYHARYIKNSYRYRKIA